jgi:4-hydroxybenzoate polyprenyltransferase
MSMLNDRDRHLLNDLERQLQEEDAAWMRQFKDPNAPRQARHDLQLGTAMGLLALLAALCLLLGIPVGAVIFGSAVIVLAYVRYRR